VSSAQKPELQRAQGRRLTPLMLPVHCASDQFSIQCHGRVDDINPTAGGSVGVVGLIVRTGQSKGLGKGSGDSLALTGGLHSARVNSVIKAVRRGVLEYQTRCRRQRSGSCEPWRSGSGRGRPETSSREPRCMTKESPALMSIDPTSGGGSGNVALDQAHVAGYVAKGGSDP